MKIFLSIFFLIFFINTNLLAKISADNFSCEFTFGFDSTLDNVGKVKVTKNNKDNYSFKIQIRKVDEKFFKIIYSNDNSDNGFEITKNTTLSVGRLNRSFLFDTTFISVFSENFFEPVKAPNPNMHSAILSTHNWNAGGPRAYQEFGICISE